MQHPIASYVALQHKMLWLKQYLKEDKTMRFPSMARPLPEGRATISAATFADEVHTTIAIRLINWASITIH